MYNRGSINSSTDFKAQFLSHFNISKIGIHFIISHVLPMLSTEWKSQCSFHGLHVYNLGSNCMCYCHFNSLSTLLVVSSTIAIFKYLPGLHYDSVMKSYCLRRNVPKLNKRETNTDISEANIHC